MIALLLAFAVAGPPPGLVVLEPSLRVDRANGFVLLDAEIAQRDAPLEFLLCPRRTKDHETILAAEFRPQNFQMALLLAGALPGQPARFQPQFAPPVGQRLKIWVETSAAGRVRRVDLREWVRTTNGAALDADLVFAGSMIVRMPESETPKFLADDGEVVSVSNFPSAIVDVAVRSSDKTVELQFRPWTERIPIVGTKVKVIVEPLVD